MVRTVDWHDRIGRHIKLRDLRVFVAAVECGSMAKAAAQFGITQPAVSQAIVQLEHALAAKLLDRSSRGVEPTIYGRTLLRRARAAFDELRDAVREIEFLADPTSGELRLGCAEPLAGSILPPIIQRFSRAFPRVTIRVNEIPPFEEQTILDDHTNDLLIGLWVKPRSLPTNVDQIKIEVLFDEHLIVAAGTKSRWARRRKIQLAELVDEPWILGPSGSWNYVGTSEAFRSKGLQLPKATLTTYSVPLRAHALVNGPYVATFPESVVRFNAACSSLKVLPVDLGVAARPAAIILFKNRTLGPLVDPFIACAREASKWMRST